ncbi:unnamed protein product [Phyllotreta striolata]|uniref:Coiled-coil domain-containing protein 13 n=1 Tax=Phyllotreta striolata TaxID=444603 RepID=A0A9N9TI70_PHYSR|nr:unnamed protein product [Phyllotreta striolata]
MSNATDFRIKTKRQHKMHNDCKSTSNTIKLPDKLRIPRGEETLLPNVPEEIIYPNELNTYLREQLMYYVHKNGMLEKNLNEVEEKYSASKESINKLEIKLSDYENLCDKSKFSTSSQLISSKIIELTKKLREKTSEIESMKTKYSKLEKETFLLKERMDNDPHTNVSVKEITETPANSINEEEQKRQADKLAHLNSKLMDSKNSNSQLKKELTLAKRILQQEVGESLDSLQTMLNGSNAGWRGRAQMICDLQQKNADLREKLKQALDKCPSPIEMINKNEALLNELTKENAELKVKLEEAKKKCEAAKARVKVIDLEHGLTKSKLTMLVEQAAKDKEIISTLSKQINCTKESQIELLAQKEQALQKIQVEKKKLSQEMDGYKTVIEGLRDELSSLKRSLCSKDGNKSYLNRDLSRDKGTETDDKFHDILEIFEKMCERLNQERENHAKTQSLLRVEKQKVTRAEAALAKMELDTLHSGYSSTSLSKISETSLKDQLELTEERLMAAKTRLEIEQMERKSDLTNFAKILKTYDIQIPECVQAKWERI